MAPKLWTYPENKNAFKALIAAQVAGVEIEVPPFQFGVDNKTADFLAKNPIGKVPVLETEKGCIFESNAIARYVARLGDSGLLGSDHLETGLIEQWIDFTSNELDAPLMSWVIPVLGFWPYDKKKEQGAIEHTKKTMKTLDDYLMDHTFLVGDSITLADIVATCNMYLGMTKVFDEAYRKPYPNVVRYFLTMVNQPPFHKVMGEVELCKEALKYTPPKKEGKKDAKKDAPPQDEKPAEEKPKKEKEKPWYDLLPPTPMQLDSWKRLYSNSPAKNFREICITRLWEGGPVPNSQTDEVFPGYDPEGYSMWFCDYKYVEENTVNFMVMNKVGGFLQRLDWARKYAFGVLAILKNKDGLFPVKGVWIFRGQEIPQQILDESYDIQLYDMKKVDLSDPAQKKLVEDIIAEEDEIDGMELVEAKCFK